jgi:hypothetical protein
MLGGVGLAGLGFGMTWPLLVVLASELFGTTHLHVPQRHLRRRWYVAWQSMHMCCAGCALKLDADAAI